MIIFIIISVNLKNKMYDDVNLWNYVRKDVDFILIRVAQNSSLYLRAVTFAFLSVWI